MDATSEQGTVPDAATGTIGVGSVLADRYRLVARIGAGGMATIFRARDESLDRDVAVKVLHGHLAEDADLLQRFKTEARHAASLLHPSVVNVFDQGTADLPYIVMEHVDGPSLRQVLLERGRLTPGEALAVVEPVCRALARAHASGLVHRDVKPENVLVAPDGTPKVADFGIARAVAETGHTETGALIGSVHYLAPELVDGREATPASDQYAVGVLLFELLTGRKPLPADSPMAIAVRHAREDVPPPSRFVSDVPRALDKVVARATANDPRKRFEDLHALVDALRKAVPDGARAVTVHAGDGDERTLIIPAESAETVSLAATTDAQERATAPPPPRPRRWRRRLGRLLMTVLILGAVAAGVFAVWNFLLAPVTPVPRLDGLTPEQAAAELEPLGLVAEVTGERHDFDVPEGQVLEQDPTAGERLRRGGTVGLVVSAGRAPVTMPDVFELPQEEAVALLEGPDYRFTVRVDEEHTPAGSGVPEGHVQAQSPAHGTGLQQGDEVIINVSLGVRQVTVPDLDGLDREQAEIALADAGLTPAFTSEYSDDVPQRGAVISQSVEAGAEVDEGTTVTVTVSSGPRTIEVPNVEGKAVAEAVAQLEAVDLVANVVEEPRPRLGPFRGGRPGRVEFQDPRPGSSIRRGQTVDLYTFADD